MSDVHFGSASFRRTSPCVGWRMDLASYVTDSLESRTCRTSRTSPVTVGLYVSAIADCVRHHVGRWMPLAMPSLSGGLLPSGFGSFPCPCDPGAALSPGRRVFSKLSKGPCLAKSPHETARQLEQEWNIFPVVPCQSTSVDNVNCRASHRPNQR